MRFSRSVKWNAHRAKVASASLARGLPGRLVIYEIETSRKDSRCFLENSYRHHSPSERNTWRREIFSDLSLSKYRTHYLYYNSRTARTIRVQGKLKIFHEYLWASGSLRFFAVSNPSCHRLSPQRTTIAFLACAFFLFFFFCFFRKFERNLAARDLEIHSRLQTDTRVPLFTRYA